MAVMRRAAPTRTAAGVLRRIEVLQHQVTALDQRCADERLRREIQGVRTALDEAHAWLRAAAGAEPVLVTHVAKMVSGACERLYVVSQYVAGARLLHRHQTGR